MEHKIEVNLPDGAIVNAQVAVVSFVNPITGKMAYATHVSGEAETSTMLGILVMAGHEILTDNDNNNA